MYYIYQITNTINGKTYIGQHKYKKLNDKYMGSGIILKQAQKKYGKENFTKEILYSRIRDKETADAMEIWVIKRERAKGKAEYNIADGGEGGDTYNRLSTDDYNARISKLSNTLKGHPSWTKGKHWKVSKPRTEEMNRRNSEAHKGKVAWNKGIKDWMSDEAKESLRKYMKLIKKGNTNVRGKKWYNNGTKCTMAFECPEGFVPGRLK